MRKYLFILLLVGVVGCNPTTDDSGKSIKPYGASIITIGGCQYAIFREGKTSYAGVAMVHAGNCNNPEHNQNRFSNIERTIDTSIAANKFFLNGLVAFRSYAEFSRFCDSFYSKTPKK